MVRGLLACIAVPITSRTEASSLMRNTHACCLGEKLSANLLFLLISGLKPSLGLSSGPAAIPSNMLKPPFVSFHYVLLSLSLQPRNNDVRQWHPFGI